MTDCAIYARVSTKEQADEGYSIDAQLKALREFCAKENLRVVAEFVEADSAGKTGRKQFAAMLTFFEDHPDVRTVVAHKLDRLTRNFHDLAKLDDLGVRDRYVVSDFPEGPAGELARDVNAAVAKHYISNLRGEVKKGMAEKVAQGGWPHQAPLGYLNDRDNRTIVPDPVRAPLLVHAFERYATGLVSLADLSSELCSMGLRTKSGRKLYVSHLHKLLRNPAYCGLMRWKGEVYQGAHEPLVTVELFEAVQAAFAPNRRRNNFQKRQYVLRDFLYCEVCGCKITAGTHKGHVYYRCTHSRGECDQRAYVREERLVQEVADVLGKVAVEDWILQALVEEARAIEQNGSDQATEELAGIQRALGENDRRASALLDALLDATIDKPTYAKKEAELKEQRVTLERRRDTLTAAPEGLSAQVEAVLRQAQGARLHFEDADEDLRRELLNELLCNLTVQDGHIASYQYKDPFRVLETDSEGALIHEWWAM